MSRRLIACCVVLAVALTGTALLVVGAFRNTPGLLPRVTHVEAQPVFAGGEHRFGDLIEGRLDVLVPLGSVDPGTVSATVDVAPYRLVGRVHVDRLRTGLTERVRFRFAIDCLESDACVPRQDRSGFTFGRSRLRYETRAGVARRVEVRWPILRVRPRARRDIFTPWEDGIQPLRAPGYRVSPSLAAALLALLSVLSLGAAVALVRPVVGASGSPRRQTSTLERALASVRAAAARRDVDERRRALDLLARAVRASAARPSGSRSAEARRLAWSQTTPQSKAMNELADRVEQG